MSSAHQCPAGTAGQGGDFLDYVVRPAQETGAFQNSFGVVAPGQAVVRSSTGRQRIDTEAVAGAAGAVSEAALDLGGTEVRLGATSLEVVTVWSSLSGHAALAAAELAQALTQLGSLATEAGELSAKLTAAQLAYEHAEEVAQKLSQSVQEAERAGFKTLWTSARTGDLPVLLVAAVGTGVLMYADWQVRGTAAEASSLLQLSGVPREGLLDAARMTKTQAHRNGIGLERVVDFRRIGSEDTTERRGSGPSTGFLMQRIQDAARKDAALDQARFHDQKTADTAHVDVTVVRRPDGTTGYLVSIPGSDFQNLADPDEPNGLVSIGDSVTMDPTEPMSRSTALMQTVDRALRDAGAGQGSEVMLTGFSQGGMAAMNLATNREFAGRYRLAGITTFGAPVQSFTGLDPKVPVLHVRDRNDPVPVATSDQASTDDHELVAWTDVADGLPFTHDGQLYAHSGRAVDEALSQTAEGRGYQDGVARFLPAGATLSTHTYEARSQLYNDPSVALDAGQQARQIHDDVQQLHQDWFSAPSTHHGPAVRPPGTSAHPHAPGPHGPHHLPHPAPSAAP